LRQKAKGWRGLLAVHAEPSTSSSPRNGGKTLQAEFRIILVELTEELSGMRLPDIHQSYKVDRATSRLVKQEHAITE
jgi:hypothetical protein